MIEKDENDELKMTNTNNILKGEFNKIFVQKLAKEILDNLDVNKIELFFTGGFLNDSFSSAMICGTISSIVSSIYGYLSLMYEDVRLYEDIDPTYNETNLELTFESVVSISIFRLIVSLIKANSKTKRKEIKHER